MAQQASILVADTGPLIALAVANLLPLIAKSYGQLLIPQDVWNECATDNNKSGIAEIKMALQKQQLEIVPQPKNRLDSNLQQSWLGAGEIAVLHYVQTHHLTALIDEKRGYQLAEKLGLPIVRSGTIVLALKTLGVIDSVSDVLDIWRKHGYFLASPIRAELLAQAGEF